MNIVVSKFGGTSMVDAQSIRRVVAIIQKQQPPMVVVVSAAAGVTDQLLNLGEMALSGKNWQSELKTTIYDRHQKIIDELEVELDLNPFYQELTNLLRGISLLRELSLSKKDHLMSFGERISSLILWKKLQNIAIKTERIDTKELIVTDNNYTEVNVNFLKTNSLIQERLLPLLRDNSAIILTGFIAQSAEGKYSTLGRGGSDFTGAIIAAALNAKELQIWTDVDGIYSADPRVIKEATVIPHFSFAEAGELAYFGAKVLHPKTIIPAVQKDIPVRILNTFNPAAPGTLITQKVQPGLKAMTWKKDVVVVTVQSVHMLEAYGFLAKIFDIFAKYKIVVDVLATSEVSLSLTLKALPPEQLIDELLKFSNVSVLPHFAIICLVGDGLLNQKDILSKLFTCLKDHLIKMISQGASERNITFLVNQNEVDKIIKKIFHNFFT